MQRQTPDEIAAVTSAPSSLIRMCWFRCLHRFGAATWLTEYIQDMGALTAAVYLIILDAGMPDA
jgi:hypothetical protein